MKIVKFHKYTYNHDDRVSHYSANEMSKRFI